MNARASASICCSPPESVPACWSRRVASHGKYSSTRSSRPRPAPVAARVRAELEVLADVSSANVPRPSGTCAIPSRATASGRARQRLAVEADLAVARTVPEIARSVVVLPAPFAPSTDDDLALVDVEADPVQRRTAP